MVTIFTRLAEVLQISLMSNFSTNKLQFFVFVFFWCGILVMLERGRSSQNEVHTLSLDPPLKWSDSVH